MDRRPDGTTDLCHAFLVTLPVTGAAVTVLTPAGTQLTLCASDAVAARTDELQFELGEGPQWLAAHSGELVAIPDVAADTHDRWPVFGAALAELPVRALFSVPMLMGAVTVGTVSLYREAAGDLTQNQRVSAMAIASAIAGTAAEQAIEAATAHHADETDARPALRREVHQATGMLVVQLNTSATIAYARLQAHAFSTGRSLHDVARDVVTRKLTFDDSSD